MGVEVRIEGVDDLVAKLNAIGPALRKRALRNALAAGARLVRDEAKRNAPVLSAATRAPYRKPGTVRDAIKVRTSKIARQNGDVGVFVNVAPAKGAKFKTRSTRVLGVKIKNRVKVRNSQRGAQSPNDPYYWRFLEFGTRKMSARSFLQPAAKRLNDALTVIQSQLKTWFDKVESTGKVVP